MKKVHLFLEEGMYSALYEINFKHNKQSNIPESGLPSRGMDQG